MTTLSAELGSDAGCFDSDLYPALLVKCNQRADESVETVWLRDLPSKLRSSAFEWYDSFIAQRHPYPSHRYIGTLVP